MANYINLDAPAVQPGRIRSAGDTVRNWFSKPKKHSICKFVQDHQLRCLRARTMPFGAVRVSVITKEGREVYNYDRNFTMAYLGLKNKFIS